MRREWAPPALAYRKATVQERTWGTGGWWEKETQEEGIASFIERARQPRWGSAGQGAGRSLTPNFDS
jgi:hypothetical protein